MRIFALVIAFGLGPAVFLKADPIMDAVPEMQGKATFAARKLREGDLEAAAIAAEISRRDAEDKYGPLHPEVVRYSDNLASVLWRQGNYAQAERLLRWGLAIREKGLDEGDPLLAHSFQELAALEDDQGKYFEAELHWFQAARRSKQSRDLAGVVLALRKLGCLERRLGRFEEARQFLESALKAGDGIRDEQKAALLMDLGLAEKDLGHADKAEEFFRQALGLARQPPAAPLLTAKIEELLGDSLRQRGRTDKSAELFQDAEGILLANTGLDLYPTLPFLVGAGNLSLKLGRLDKAKGLLNRGFALAKKHLGPSHPMLAEILRNLAEYQSQAGDKTEAGKSLKQALKIWNEKFGPNHLGEVAVLKALAKVDADLGKTAEAAREKKRARAIEQGWKEGGCLWRWDAQTGTDAE